MKKRVYALILSLCLAVGLTACGGNKSETENAGESSTAVQEEKGLLDLLTSNNDSTYGMQLYDNTVKVKGVKVNLDTLLDDYILFYQDRKDTHLQDDLLSLREQLKEEKLRVGMVSQILASVLPWDADKSIEFEANVGMDFKDCNGWLLGCILLEGTDSFYGKQWDAEFPNGYYSDIAAKDLKGNAAWWQVRPLISFGDIYKTGSTDLENDFGHSYIAIYADGFLVDIPSYKKAFDQYIESGEELSNGDISRLLSGCLNGTNLRGLAIYDQFPDMPETSKEILKQDAMAHYALTDCLQKLKDGKYKEIMVARVENTLAPTTPYKDADRLFCALIKYKEKTEQ